MWKLAWYGVGVLLVFLLAATGYGTLRGDFDVPAPRGKGGAAHPGIFVQ